VSDPLLQAQSLQKTFGRSPALRNASISVAAGEVVAVTGASGSGKSTLLLCLSGVLRPEAGLVSFQGRPLQDLPERERSRLRRREFGLVLQFGQLVPELTALQNVALPLLLERHGRTASYAAARVWLDRLGAADLAGMLPGEMSGGEGQRVATTRETGASLVLVTHDNRVAAFADREVVLQDGATHPVPDLR